MRLDKKFLEKYQNYDFSKIKEVKIFLVGSITKAQEYFIEIESLLQLVHKKKVSICSADGIFNKDKFSESEWQDLQKIALSKLNDQEAILVLDIDGYIGEQSKEEIEYFSRVVKGRVYYLSKL